MIKKKCIECYTITICKFCKFYEKDSCTNEKNEKTKVDCTDSCEYFKCKYWEEI